MVIHPSNPEGPHWVKRKLRKGMASLEAVLAAFIALPVAAFLLMLAIRACRNLFQTNGLAVGMPYL